MITDMDKVMASSMKLEYPLSDNLPNIDHARDRLLARIFHYRNDQVASQSTTDEDYALLYAYSKSIAYAFSFYYFSSRDIQELYLSQSKANEDLKHW